MPANLLIVVFFVLLVTLPPLIGIVLSGQPLALFASFPPLTRPAAHAPFSWPVFLLYLAPALAVSLMLAWAGRPRHKHGRGSGATRTLPRWGWPAVILLVSAWLFAWTRLPWLRDVQHLSFVPLWFSYILTVNALAMRLTGSAPLRREPLFFAALFPLSAVFWWFFEYLNQFVDNWYYIGVDYTPLAYSLHATISFSTVLPAVYSTFHLLRGSPWIDSRFHHLPARRMPLPAAAHVALLAFCALALAGIGIWPDELFALLWLAPLLLLNSLRRLFGQTTLLSRLAAGDWRPAVSAALAALLCGFFWEMWNYFSLAKWIYSIPYVHRFQLFEMPILGYMGYLPFGLLCIEAVDFLKRDGID